jgi:hypothetical protein
LGQGVPFFRQALYIVLSIYQLSPIMLVTPGLGGTK